MRFFPKIFFMLACAVFNAGCTSGEIADANLANSDSNNGAPSAGNSNANLAKDTAEELETIVRLPFHPEEAVWREETISRPAGNQREAAPSEKKLLAVVKFKMDEADKIVAEAEKHKPGMTAAMNVESWFPMELVALTQMSGDETLKGTAYAANDFLQAPYTDGKIMRIENSNYFVLELHAK